MDLEDILGEDNAEYVEDSLDLMSEQVSSILGDSDDEVDMEADPSSESSSGGGIVSNILSMSVQDWVVFLSSVFAFFGVLLAFVGSMAIISGILFFHTDQVVSGFPALFRWYATLGSGMKFLVNSFFAIFIGILFMLVGYLGSVITAQS